MKQNYNITNEELNKLLLLKQTGNKEARNALINYHLFLVPIIAEKYNDGTCELDDLIQSGYEGLIKGIDIFDPCSSNTLKEYLNIYINFFILTMYKKNMNREKSLNINDYKNIIAESDMESEYLKKEERLNVDKLIFQSNLTSKQLYALKQAFDFDIYDVPSCDFSRKDQYAHKEAALKKLSKAIKLFSI